MAELTEFALGTAVVACGVIGGLVVHFVVLRVIRAATPADSLIGVFVKRCAGGFGLLLPLVGGFLTLPMAMDGLALARAQRGLAILLIGVSAYLIVKAVYGVEDVITARLGLDKKDNLGARTRQTQLRVLRSVLVLFIVSTAIIVILLFVPGFRQIATGLLASAGIAGVVLGFAAQKTLGNLLAGFQIAITQPIRLDDVVVVENEWGRIEEITLTYVVVRIWDDRRLILPISYFIEHPFSNWTRQSADILGTVYLHADYRAPLDELRSELQRVVSASEFWDGRVCELAVTDSKEATLELRALVSAIDGGQAWNLRCEVREALVRFLQDRHPDALPRLRAEVSNNA